MRVARWRWGAFSGAGLVLIAAACGNGSSPAPMPGGGGTTPEACVPAPRAARPTIAEPVIPNVASAYTIDLAAWGIPNDGSEPIQTRNGLNDVLAWAATNGYGTVKLPAGTYLIGEPVNTTYASGISIPASMRFELDPAATIQMATNDRWNYCVVEIVGKHDVVVTGGTIRGERDTHVYAGGGAHDEGHAVCVWDESERVLVENTRLTNVTGDGVLIVGGNGDGSSCKDVCIRGNEIDHNRRQGVSIVGGVRVLIEGNEIHHIEGTSPQFGVDIESLEYESKDIVIASNHFHENRGGDYVNTDGTNVWFEDNVCDQTGLVGPQTDGPIVHWQKTDQTIRGNTVTVTVGSSNGRWGLIGYARTDQLRTNPAANYIEDNVFIGGGMHLAWTDRIQVTRNTVNDWLILAYKTTCLDFDDNVINYTGNESYKFKEVSGRARGNVLNGEPYYLPMSYDTTFTNSPPHLW